MESTTGTAMIEAKAKANVEAKADEATMAMIAKKTVDAIVKASRQALDASEEVDIARRRMTRLGVVNQRFEPYPTTTTMMAIALTPAQMLKCFIYTLWVEISNGVGSADVYMLPMDMVMTSTTAAMASGGEAMFAQGTMSTNMQGITLMTSTSQRTPANKVLVLRFGVYVRRAWAVRENGGTVVNNGPTKLVAMSTPATINVSPSTANVIFLAQCNQPTLVAGHDQTLAGHEPTIASHEQTLAGHEPTLASHDEYDSFGNTLVRLDKSLRLANSQQQKDDDDEWVRGDVRCAPHTGGDASEPTASQASKPVFTYSMSMNRNAETRGRLVLRSVTFRMTMTDFAQRMVSLGMR